MSQKILLSDKEIQVILHRLACQLIENHDNFKETVIVGLQPRGVYFAERLVAILKNTYHLKNLFFGKLDITFYRDDFRRRDEPLEASETAIDFVIENKKVVLIDDVLYSGRSIRAALTALQAFGRPKSIELLVLIDRRFSRDLPIQPNYKGRQVDVINQEKVKVNWLEKDGVDAVYLVKRESL
ncbi:MAG TPA: bifunctional pyr operon transcriptional regulator/uracil phosphoribosyltransferase PyrR [Flavobacteriia bacterium]|nr:bifunctional pyr operon transcriptional regulator/uracil phosphoribosyltransferase PyrR [Flavobacteriia bacterium]